ncbi:MAG: glycosyltransferase family 4 protein [Candidatus Korobacteraceae bacterium]
MVHSSFLVYDKGWMHTLAQLSCYKMTNACSGQLVAVSDYLAVHMRAFYGLTIDAVVRNPVKAIYLQGSNGLEMERDYITYVGRLVSYKNIDRIVLPIVDLLNENPGLRACIIGDGPEREHLQSLAGGHPRFEFRGQPDDEHVKQQLRRTKVFVSSHVTEGFGITYVEALSQGCVVAMPASGGGVEIALDRVGESVQLLPISLDRQGILRVLRRAVTIRPSPMPIECYSARNVASAYLDVDRRFFSHPAFQAQAAQVHNQHV